VKVEAQDAAGNLSTPASLTFTVVLYPDTIISSGAADNGYLSATAVSFGWGGTDAITPSASLQYSWKLDTFGWSEYSMQTSVMFSKPTSGSHIFQVRAKNLQGSIDPSPAIRNFTIDIVAPTVTIITPLENALSNQNSMAASWSGSDDFTPIVNVQFSYRIDSWSWSAWSTVSAATLTNMSNGVHSLQVRARDDAGNISAAASRDFVLDYYVPHVAFTGGPANNSTVSTTSVSISWSGSDNLTPTPNLRYSWQLDSGGWATYSTAVATTLSGLTVGTHIVKVQAEDAAGNISTPAVINFTIVHLTAATRPAR